MDWTKPFEIKNVSKSRIVTGTISMPDETTKVIHPQLFSEEVINGLKFFYSTGKIEVTNDYEKLEVAKGVVPVSKLKTVKNELGDTNDHFIYDPNSNAISVSEIETRGSYSLQSLTDLDSASVQVAYGEIDRIEARELLSKHWKTFESEIGRVSSKNKLRFYLSVAEKENVSEKKVQIIRDRLSSL